MYKIKNIFCAVAIALLLIFFVQEKTSAQGLCFNLATIAPTMPAGCNNDSKPGSQAVVSVAATVGTFWWNGSTVPSFAYSCDGTPSVCILGTNLIVPYFTLSYLGYPGGVYVCDLYTAPNTLVGTILLEAPVLGGTGTIRISGNQATNYYYMVWDDGIGVEFQQGFYPPLPLSYTTAVFGGYEPDISALSAASYEAVCMNGGSITGWGTIPAYVGPGNHPRIAINATGTFSMVAFEGTNAWPVQPVFNEIYGSINGAPASASNEFSNLPCYDLGMCQQLNEKPVVSFDNTSGYIIIAWIYSAWGYNPSCLAPPPGSSMLPIAVQLNLAGVPVTGQYMTVPIAGIWPFLSTNLAPDIALSGRDDPSNSILYSWAGGSKAVASAAPFLRIDASQNSEFVEGVFPNPSNGNFVINTLSEKNEPLNIQIYNSLGQQVYSSDEVSTTTNFTKEVALIKYNAGLYFVRVIGTSTSNNWKILLTN